MKLQKLMVIFFGILPLVLLSAPGASEVGGKDAGDPAATEFPKVIAKLDETNAEYFVSLTLVRQRAMEDASVLARLEWEKKLALSNVNERLVKEHKMIQRQQYVWDKEDLTIYQVLEEKTWKGENKRLKHIKFKSEEEAKPALELLQKRFRYAVQQQVIEGLVAERGNLARESDKALRDKFKLDEKGNYTFDVKQRSIIQTGIKAGTKESK